MSQAAGARSGVWESGADGTIQGHFETQVARCPDRPVLVGDGAELSCAEINEAANRLARHIVNRRGPAPEPIPILLGHGFRSVVSLLGVLKAGKAWAALDASWPPATLKVLLKKLPASLILVDHATRSLAEKIGGTGYELVNVEVAGSDQPGENLALPISGAAWSHIIFTSGSTGVPSGVVQTHRNMLYYAREQSCALGLSAEDRLPLLFSLGSMAGNMASLRALLNGALLLPFDVRAEGSMALGLWIHSERLTMIHALPSVFRQMAESADGADRFSSVRIVYLSGEPVTVRDVTLFRKLFPRECVLYNNLGSTEVSSYCRYAIDLVTEVIGDSVPVGYVVNGKVVSLLDDEGEKVRAGSVGQICVHSDYVSPGYWEDEELTRSRFLEGSRPGGSRGFLTGDLGRIREDGALEYCGRADLQLSIRGQRVETEVVEAELQRIASVREAAVGLSRHDDTEGRLVAWVAASRRPAPSTSALRGALSRRLPGHMVPAVFVFVDALPRLPGGKVDRSSLPRPGPERPALDSAFVAPRTPLERLLTEIWARVLGVERVGIRDRFEDLGGDSMSGAILVAEIEAEAARSVPLEWVRKLTTVEDLAGVMTAGPTSDSARIPDEAPDTELDGWEEGFRRMRATAASSQVPLIDKPGTLIGEINAGGGARPLFWCFNGYDLEMVPLGEHLGEEQRVYGLFSGAGVVDRSVAFDRRLVDYYHRELVELQPAGPVLLGGNCRGARVALDLALLLNERGRRVDRLCLLEYFDQRLFRYLGSLQLLYGRHSDRRAYKGFRWGEHRWSDAFVRTPLVQWLPGAHGEFFTARNVSALARTVRDFIDRSDP